MGKQVPQNLLQQIANDKQQEIQEDVFNKKSIQQMNQVYRSPPPNKYASHIGVRPAARPSARIGMGGAY